MTHETRVFYVVDSIEDNEEIFETLEEAETYFLSLHTETNPRLFIAMVRHAFQEKTKDSDTKTTWNYNDLSDTFHIIKILDKNL